MPHFRYAPLLPPESPAMTEPALRVDVADGALRRAVVEQAPKLGTKLPEDAIGTLFGISRALVCVVLARLAGAGLVGARHKRTATVANCAVLGGKHSTTPTPLPARTSSTS